MRLHTTRHTHTLLLPQCRLPHTPHTPTHHTCHWAPWATWEVPTRVGRGGRRLVSAEVPVLPMGCGGGRNHAFSASTLTRQWHALCLILWKDRWRTCGRFVANSPGGASIGYWRWAEGSVAVC